MERKRQPASGGPARRRGVLWLFALAFALFALRLAWNWVLELWFEMNYAAPTWSGQATRAVTEASPLLIAFWQMSYLWRTLGPPFSRPRVQKGRVAWVSPGLLWLFALVFGGLALRPAWYWVQALRHELKYMTPSWAFQAMRASTEFGPLLVAIFLMAFLWRIQGPPFSPPREESSEAPPEDEPEVQGLSPRWKSYESQAEKPRRAEDAGSTSRFWRSTLWGVTLALLVGVSGWALLFFACGGNDMFSLISTRRDGFERLSLGILSVGGVIFFSLILWAVIGPPFQRRPK